MMDTDGVPMRKLIVSNFANRTTSKDLRNYFSKYGNVESCYLRGNQGKSNCAFVTFTNVADAVRMMQDESWKQIKLHNRYLRVMDAIFWVPDSMEQRSYNMGKESSEESNKASERRIANEQYSHKYLQNDTESVSIHMLNDDCLRHIFFFLPIMDRLRIEIVCKRWRDLSQDSWHMIKTLDLSYSTWGLWCLPYIFDIALLRKILRKCGRFLTQIDLSIANGKLSRRALTIIGKRCPKLTSIDVTTLKVRASDIHTLAINYRNITKLNFRCTPYCDNELEYFFKQNQNLEYLKICGNSILGESLLCLPEQTMHTIILYGCEYLQDNHLSMALKRLENLKHLTIHSCSRITERTLKVVRQHCKNLRALELGYFSPIIDMSYLIHLVDLQILKITYNHSVSDNFLADLVKHCQQLTSLDISGCDEVSDIGLATVARLVRLEKLIVSRISQITDDGLKNMCGLKELECRRCKFTDRGMSTFIKSSPQLQWLDISECWNITGITIEVAKQACSNRTNNVILKMIVWRTKILTEEKLPLLHIMKYPSLERQ